MADYLISALSSLIREDQLIQIGGIRCLRMIPVHLKVDRYAPPIAGCRSVVVILVQSVRYSVQSDGLVEQFVVGSALDLNCQMVPRICLRIACDPGGHPSAVNIVPYVPCVAPRYAAFVAPNEAFAELAPHELVDIEFQCLRGRQLRSVEIRLVDEIVGVIRERVVCVGKILTGERSHQMVVPQDVGIRPCATDTMLGSAT